VSDDFDAATERLGVGRSIATTVVPSHQTEGSE
jgi:hypothetical protein